MHSIPSTSIVVVIRTISTHVQARTALETRHTTHGHGSPGDGFTLKTAKNKKKHLTSRSKKAAFTVLPSQESKATVTVRYSQSSELETTTDRGTACANKNTRHGIE